MPLSKDFIDYMSKANPDLAEALKTGFGENQKRAAEHNKLAMHKKSSAVFGEFIKRAHESLEKEPTSIQIDFLAKDAFIKDDMLKMAGMSVYDTTPEGIEQFLKEYMLNELSFFPDKIDLAVGIMPLDNAPVNNGTGQFDPNILNASGTLDLMYGGTLIQIPWIMRDKEILPFDTIQLGTETAVYTRENLRNILFNIKNMVEKQNTAGTVADPGISSFKGTDKAVTRMTDGGFMHDMLQIQSLMSAQSGHPGAYAYASNKIDDLLEKTANINKVNIDYRKLKNELTREFLEAAEKVASSEYDEPEESALQKQALFDNLEKQIMANVAILKNGDKFTFTEKDGKIISKVPAAIFKSLAGVCGVDLDLSMVITSDGRFKLLKPGERFMFDVTQGDDNIAPFEFKERDIYSIAPGHVYTANIGGTYLIPFIVTKTISGARHNLNTKMIYYCIDVNGNKFAIIPAKNVSDNQICMKCKKDIISHAAKTEEAVSLSKYNTLLRDETPILCVSSNTKLIKLRHGSIGNIESPKDAMLLYDGNVKLASYTDKVVVTLVSNDKEPKFNLDVSWFDRKQRRDRKISFTNLTEPKLKGILKTIGYDYNKVSEITYRAKKEHTATYELGPGTTPWLVKPEISAQMAAENTVNNIRKSFFTEDNAKKVIAGALGGLAGGILVGSSVGDFLAATKKFSQESEALAEKLEKIAIVKKNKTFTKLAGLMVIKNRVDNMLLDALKGREFEGSEVLAELHEVGPFMEKVAHDLVELKLRQAMFKNEIISPNVITATLRHMDGIYKYANYFKQAEKEASLTGSSYDTALAEVDNVQNEIKNTRVPEKLPAPGTKAPGLIGTAAEAAMTPVGMVGALFAPRILKSVTKRR